jgi:hypothetical protein
MRSRLPPRPRNDAARPPSAESSDCCARIGLIRKLAHTHRYRVNQRGRLILNAILSAQRMTTQQLTEAA